MPESLSQLYVYLIFTTNHREPLLMSPVREHMHAYLATVLSNQDSPALKVGGTSDHVHALFRLSKNLSLAKIVEEVKTSSSKWVKMQTPALANFHWQSGYGGFSVSPADVEAVCLGLKWIVPPLQGLGRGLWPRKPRPLAWALLGRPFGALDYPFAAIHTASLCVDRDA